VSRRRKGRDVHGVILLDKPAGYSSNQALQKIRWLFNARKAGHTGSLDPFATGMLPICLGEASKTAGFMLAAAKIYEATACLGKASTTGDIEGEICREMMVPALDRIKIDAVLDEFLGDIEQVPPMYSALKHEGQRLYQLARAGQQVERKARPVHIFGLELLSLDLPYLRFRVRCSKGTYVRTLAEDIADKLGTCAHLHSLRRLEVEPFHEQGMISLEELVRLAEDGEGEIDTRLLPVDSGLTDWPQVILDAMQSERFSHGNPVEIQSNESGPVRVYGPENRLLGLGEITPDKYLKPKRIMNFPQQ
jgi:tRNA pseudouridine55 synthase